MSGAPPGGRSSCGARRPEVESLCIGRSSQLMDLVKESGRRTTSRVAAATHRRRRPRPALVKRRRRYPTRTVRREGGCRAGGLGTRLAGVRTRTRGIGSTLRSDRFNKGSRLGRPRLAVDDPQDLVEGLCAPTRRCPRRTRPPTCTPSRHADDDLAGVPRDPHDKQQLIQAQARAQVNAAAEANLVTPNSVVWVGIVGVGAVVVAEANAGRKVGE